MNQSNRHRRRRSRVVMCTAKAKPIGTRRALTSLIVDGQSECTCTLMEAVCNCKLQCIIPRNRPNCADRPVSIYARRRPFEHIPLWIINSSSSMAASIPICCSGISIISMIELLKSLTNTSWLNYAIQADPYGIRRNAWTNWLKLMKYISKSICFV